MSSSDLDSILAPLGRSRVMGIVNVTPDSFSDGGRYIDADNAISRAMTLVADGADLIDVGGESTRPGADRVDEHEELSRVIPVVRALAREGVVVSIDTTRASVARAAVEAGAVVVNDVTGGQADPQMLPTVATLGVPYVLMHSRGPSIDMADRAVYDDVVVDVIAELASHVAAAVDAGVDPNLLVLDPGLGFAKRPEHNWTLLAHLDALAAIGRPLLIGASRKSFLAPLATSQVPESRDDATAAITALVAGEAVWAVRVHEVAASAQAVRVAAALVGSR